MAKTFHAPPSYSGVSTAIGRLEALAEARVIEHACEGICTEKMVFLRAHAEMPQKQAGVKMFLGSNKQRIVYVCSMGFFVWEVQVLHGCVSYSHTRCTCSTYGDLIFSVLGIWKVMVQ